MASFLLGQQMKKIERKFIDLKDLVVSEDGPGTIEGYRAVFGEIDEGGDLIVPGFFKESIAEYLDAGFTTHSHDWAFDKTVGYPLEAKEDDHGLHVKSEFHTTDDAQAVRQKAIERKKAGKRVGFSFGYSISDKSYIEAKDFKEQLPLYVKPERLQANLLKAQNFDRIRILKKGEIIEDAIVTAPMNKLAMASAVKSEPQLFEPQLDAFIETYGKEKVIEYLKEDSVSGSFESFDAVVSAVEKHTANMQRNHANRVKEGRVLSGTNRAKVQAAYDALGELLTASETAPKEPAEEEKIDVSALRTQAMRVRHRLMSNLARTA